ncbi:MAG: glycoside hydrolase family 20 zincin-like fold domain-containing protein [Bacteroidota bacterium]
MKLRNLLLFFSSMLLILACLSSCLSSTDSFGDFKLLPQPQEIEMEGASGIHVKDVQYAFGINGEELPLCGALLEDLQIAEEAGEAQLVFRVDNSLDVGAEGYTLEISTRTISITGKDQAGLFYGFMTLEQLMADASEQNVSLPQCKISDYPLLSYRAVHLDVKHHLEKTEYYYDLLDQLAHYKVNAIIAEMEDKLAYERQPLVGSADALSLAEWKKLSEYAMERNIEISPLIQGLGHASFILKHEQYKSLRDDPESDWAFNPLDPGTYELQFDLYRDALEATPHGKYLHVGGDEVHTTGRGSGKTELELQLIWLDKVCKFAEENGRIPIFWDDMPIKYAGLYSPMFNTSVTREEVDQMWQENEHKLMEYLDLFPKNCIYMRWNYSSPQAAGNIKAMEWFSGQGLPVMGATAGQTRWKLMPQNESNMDNIRSFAKASSDKGLDGLLLTLWDDDSPHFELYKRGILAFAEYSWSGDIRSKEEIKAAYRQREYSHALAGEEYAFVEQLEHLAGWWNGALLQGGQRNNVRSHEDPLNARIIELPLKGEKGAWTEKHAEGLEIAAKVLEDCDALALTIEAMKSKTMRNQYRLEVYEQVNKLVRFSARALLTLQLYDTAADDEGASEALKQVQQLEEEFVVLRENLEQVYGQTRILSKPEGYILDQDHHLHLANQTLSFDWFFTAELYFFEKVNAHILNR